MAPKSKTRLISLTVATGVLVTVAVGVAIHHYFLSDTAKAQRASKDIEVLDKAVKGFLACHGTYPPSLDMLTVQQDDCKGALIDSQILTDPWGQPYFYDPAGRWTQPPLIFSKGPPGLNKGIYSRGLAR